MRHSRGTRGEIFALLIVDHDQLAPDVIVERVELSALGCDLPDDLAQRKRTCGRRVRRSFLYTPLAR